MGISEVDSILVAGGEVEGYLMAIKAPMALLDANVPDTLPNWNTLNGSAVEVAKQFKDWFNVGAEIWKKDDDSEILFFTNPFASNENSYLKGSEIKTLFQIQPATISVLTIADAEILTATGWTRVD